VVNSKSSSEKSQVNKSAFKLGDKVVYPGHGVGLVDEMSSRNVGGTNMDFYAITVIETGLKIMVPCLQAEAVGLRKVVDKKSIDKIYALLKTKKKKIDTQTWNRRFREYSQKIQTGSLYEIAEVLRDLSALRSDKELSFGEKQMYEKAESRLISEISVSRAKPRDKVKGELDTILSYEIFTTDLSVLTQWHRQNRYLLFC
jgi:CarD family transcriptional regulator